MILGIGDTRLYHSRFISFLVQPHLFDYGTKQALTISRIIDGELGSEPYKCCFGTKNPWEDGMESPHPQITCPFHTYLTRNTLFHLARRLIRKGQCKDIPRIVAVLLFQQVSDFISQYARLPRTCTGYHQRRTVIISHCSTLTLVQFIYIIGIHNSIIKTMWIFNKPLAFKFVLNTKV